MALDNVPRTNYTTDDGIATDDINNINLNILDLEDDKYESGDSPSFATATHTETNSSLLNMAGAINPTLTPTATSEVIAASASWTPTRGTYLVSTGGTIEILVSASWRTVNIGGGFIMTDGTNVRVRDHSGSGVTVYYLKF